MDRLDRIKGSLLGGAVGDALGYCVEFDSEQHIFSRFGRCGIRNYVLTGSKALFSDDTQMSLYTACGLLCVEARGKAASVRDYTDSIWYAYLDWLKTQRGKMTREVAYSFLNSIPELFSPRAPGGTCLASLQGGVPGSIEKPINYSKGCGGVMRAAPVGLYFSGKEVDGKTVAAVGASSAALTHGHPLGYLSAAFLAHLVWLLAKGVELSEAVAATRSALSALYGGSEDYEYMDTLINYAIRYAAEDRDDLECVHALGEGWVGEEALAVALYCALKYPCDFAHALIVSVNHNGDSDSTGAILGNILGAYRGIDGIPKRYLAPLELRELIESVAVDLTTGLPDKEKEQRAYRLFMQRYYRPEGV